VKMDRVDDLQQSDKRNDTDVSIPTLIHHTTHCFTDPWAMFERLSNCERFIIWMLETLLALRFICHLSVVREPSRKVYFNFPSFCACCFSSWVVGNMVCSRKIALLFSSYHRICVKRNNTYRN
jgi:hypothetical protein